MEGFRDDASDFSDKEKEVTEIITNAIQNTFSADTPFNAKKVNEWTNGIVTHCLKELQQLNRPFKYVITCIIMQKNGAGLSTSATMYWDSKKDGYCTVPFINNETIYCVVTVYGVSVNIDDQEID